MSSTSSPSSLPAGEIRKQVRLPLRKAAELAWGNIRLRLSRSLLVTSAIVLALAFFVSIQVNQLVLDGMRGWIANFATSPQGIALLAERDVLSADAPRLAEVRSALARPQLLRTRLEEAGVPTKPDKIRADLVRTRWLLGLALLVAFVGILNAMLMSVTERFREIGTMKCLGALDGFIIKLFLLESIFQGLAGTLLGILLGVAMSLGIAYLSWGGDAFINLPWLGVLGVAGVALLVGVVLTVVGTLLPAWQAAKMQPIDAMRTDV